MYTILENARIVVDLLKKHKIRYIVISPGGSNIPVIQAVQQDDFFKCYSVVDERSAMYFAIGLYLKNRGNYCNFMYNSKCYKKLCTWINRSIL